MCISGNAIVAKFSPGILTAMTAWSFAYVLLLAGAGLWDAAAGAAEIWRNRIISILYTRLWFELLLRGLIIPPIVK